MNESKHLPVDPLDEDQHLQDKPASDLPNLVKQPAWDPMRLIIAVIVLAGMGSILLLQIIQQQNLYFLHKADFGVGLDYNDLYKAALWFRLGNTPYVFPRWVSPPIPAMLNVPLTFLSFATACRVMFFMTFLATITALFYAHRMFNPASRRGDWGFLLFAFCLLVFSYPFLFLIDRGNIDGFVLLFMCMGIYHIGRKDWAAGICLAMAISLKVYPVLVVFPLIAGRRWKTLLFLALAMVLLVLAAPGLWKSFITERLLHRTIAFREDENGSLACTLYHIGMACHWDDYLQLFSDYVYAILFAIMAFLDFKLLPGAGADEFRARVLLYVPFMVAVPQLAYHYELVCVLALVPVLSWWWRGADSPAKRRWLCLMAVGVALSQFQAVAMDTLFKTNKLQVVPGAGLLLVIIAVLGFKWTFLGSRLKTQAHKR
jgi:hypothetical protein